MVGYFLVVEMPHSRMAVLSGPVDRFLLRFEGAEPVVCVILHYIVLYRASLGSALGPLLDINIRHQILLGRCASNK